MHADSESEQVWSVCSRGEPFNNAVEVSERVASAVEEDANGAITPSVESPDQGVESRSGRPRGQHVAAAWKFVESVVVAADLVQRGSVDTHRPEQGMDDVLRDIERQFEVAIGAYQFQCPIGSLTVASRPPFEAVPGQCGVLGRVLKNFQLTSFRRLELLCRIEIGPSKLPESVHGGMYTYRIRMHKC